MNMLNYWDHTPRERALMTREEVVKFIDFELMSKGILKVEAPALQPLQEVALPSETYYKVKSGYYEVCNFQTMEQAQAFIGLKPIKASYTFECGTKVYYAEPWEELVIEPVSLANKTDYTNSTRILRENRAIEAANEVAESNFKKDCKIMDEATAGLFEDWQEQCATEAKAQKVYTTWVKYLELAGGDDPIATNFLYKVFSIAEVDDATAWMGMDWDAPFPRTAAKVDAPGAAKLDAAKMDFIVLGSDPASEF